MEELTKKIPTLKTDVFGRIKPNHAGIVASSLPLNHSVAVSQSKVLKCHWVGLYTDLENQDLVIEVRTGI